MNMIEVQVSRVRFCKKKAGQPQNRKGETAEEISVSPGQDFWGAGEDAAHCHWMVERYHYWEKNSIGFLQNFNHERVLIRAYRKA